MLDKIFGDYFAVGFDYYMTEEEKEDGYKKIKSQIKKRYDDALDKHKYINKDEIYLIFMNIHPNNNIIGEPAKIFFNELQSCWNTQVYDNFLGLIIPEYKKTIFIDNKKANHNAILLLENIGIENFHLYTPRLKE